MFIGRTKELAELERRYAQPGFQFPVIYGRRRIGKTRLIRNFCGENEPSTSWRRNRAIANF